MPRGVVVQAMTWEALSAIATTFSGLVILFTVLVGWHQLRVAADQNLQAHRATQLDGMMRIFELFEDPRYVASSKYITTQLASDLQQPDFDARFLLSGERPWHYALITLERMGAYIKMGLLDSEPFFYHAGFSLIRLTRALRPVIQRHRHFADNPFLWKDTEQLGIDALAWGEAFVRREKRRRPSNGEIFLMEDFEPKGPQ